MLSVVHPRRRPDGGLEVGGDANRFVRIASRRSAFSFEHRCFPFLALPQTWAGQSSFGLARQIRRSELDAPAPRKLLCIKRMGLSLINSLGIELTLEKTETNSSSRSPALQPVFRHVDDEVQVIELGQRKGVVGKLAWKYLKRRVLSKQGDRELSRVLGGLTKDERSDVVAPNLKLRFHSSVRLHCLWR